MQALSQCPNFKLNLNYIGRFSNDNQKNIFLNLVGCLKQYFCYNYWWRWVKVKLHFATKLLTGQKEVRPPQSWRLCLHQSAVSNRNWTWVNPITRGTKDGERGPRARIGGRSWGIDLIALNRTKLSNCQVAFVLGQHQPCFTQSSCLCLVCPLSATFLLNRLR